MLAPLTIDVLRSLFENAPLAYQSLDGSGRLLLVNSAWEDLLGYAADDAVGRPFSEFLTPESAARQAEGFQRFKTCGLVRDVVLELVHADGGVVPVRANGRAAYDESGAFLQTHCMLVDLRPEREALRSLQNSERRYRRLVETAQEGIWQLDREGRTVFVNQAMADMLGWTVEEMAGRHLFDFMDDRARIAAEAALERRRQGIDETHDFEFRRRDGSALFAAVATSPILDEDGAYDGALAGVLDITERRRGEQHLIQAQALAGMGSWHFEVGGGSGWWSESMFRIHGFEPEATAPSFDRYFAIMEEEDRGPIRELLAHALRDGTFYLGRYGIRCPTGVRRIESHGQPVRDEDGRVIGMEGFSLDITEREAVEAERLSLERQILHGQKLESLGVMAGGLAHDFNNLLQAVLGNAQLALQESPLPPGAVDCLDEVATAARRATGLCRQLLAYAGQTPLSVEDIDLGARIREMVDILDVSIARKAELDLRLPAEPLRVRADGTQMDQIVMNLVTNASEAMCGAGGHIVVELVERRLDEEEIRDRFPGCVLEPGPCAVLRVADDGCGMDEETLARLFDPFFSTKFTGRGLGLAAVQGIVRRHVGGVRVESAPGRGSVIEVALPLVVRTDAAPEDAEAAAPSVDPERPFAGRRVLLADDERIVRDLVIRLLERLGCEVLAAEDGLEAVELHAAHAAEIDLVILDLTMPRLDGQGAFRRIRERDPEAKVVVSSGYGGESVVQGFGDSQPDAFLAKPYEFDTLRETLEELL